MQTCKFSINLLVYLACVIGILVMIVKQTYLATTKLTDTHRLLLQHNYSSTSSSYLLPNVSEHNLVSMKYMHELNVIQKNNRTFKLHPVILKMDSPNSTTQQLSMTNSVENFTAHKTVKIVIVFPYRDRAKHYMKQMENIQKKYKDNLEVTVYVILQNDTHAFRRAWLLNIGIQIASAHFSENVCVITHDVDMKASKAVDYTWCDRPTLMCAEISCFNYGLPYREYAGGVVGATIQHWKEINGFTNTAYGWGGEDDDLYLRWKANHLEQGPGKGLRTPEKGRGVCECSDKLDHTPRTKHMPTYNKILQKIERMTRGSDEWKSDGLSDLHYHTDSVFKDEFGSNWIAVSSGTPGNESVTKQKMSTLS